MIPNIVRVVGYSAIRNSASIQDLAVRKAMTGGDKILARAISKCQPNPQINKINKYKVELVYIVKIQKGKTYCTGLYFTRQPWFVNKEMHPCS